MFFNSILIGLTKKLLKKIDMKKLLMRMFSKEKLIKLGLELVSRAIRKGIEELDKKTINVKDIKLEDLREIERMYKYDLKN